MTDSSPDDVTDSEDRVRQIIADYLDLHLEGDPPSIEKFCPPEYLDDVREHLEVLKNMGLLESEAEAGIPEKLGEYELVRKLGEGGMGVVYLARQTSIDRQVALKVVRPEQRYFSQTRERFNREIEVIARLRHPSIVPIYVVGNEEGVPFFTMEYVEGCSLEQLLERALREKLNPDQATGSDLHRLVVELTNPDHTSADLEHAGYLFQSTWIETSLRIIKAIADALQHAHRMGVIHRDIKPSNIMLTPSGRVLLMDFGLAAAEGTHSLTRTGSWLGSLPYMPPEILEGLPADSRSDIYSLGVTLYQLLTLVLPHSADSSESLRHAILQGVVPPLKKRVPRSSWELETVALTAMDRDPARRYSSAPDFERDIENVLSSRMIEAKRPGTLLRLKRWTQRHPAWTVGWVAAFLLFAVAPTLIAVRESQNAKRLEVEKSKLKIARAEADDQKKSAIQKALEAEEERKSTAFQKQRGDRLLRKSLEAGNEFLVLMADRQIAGVPSLDRFRKQMLERAKNFFEGFLGEEDDPQVIANTAYAYGRIAQVDHYLGNLDSSEKAFESSEKYWNKLHANDVSTKLSIDYIDTKINLTTLIETRGNIQEAADELESIIALLEEVEDPQRWMETRTALAYNNLALAVESLGQLDRAIEFTNSARDITEEILEEVTQDFSAMKELARSHIFSTSPLVARGRHDEAIERLQQGIEIFQSLCDASPKDAESRNNLGNAHHHLGWTLVRQSRFDESIPSFESAIEIQSELVDDHPSIPLFRMSLAQSLGAIAGSLDSLGEAPKSSMEYSNRALVIQRGLVEEHPSNAIYLSELSGTLSNLADASLNLDDCERAMELIEEALELQRRALRINPHHPTFQEFLQIQLAVRANIALREGNHELAYEFAEELLSESTLDERVGLSLQCFMFCASLAESDSLLSEDERAQTIEIYQERAVELVELILESNPEARQDLINAPHLQPLKNRDDYRDVLDL